ADLRIRVGDLRVVGRLRETRAERLRRLVGIVGVIEVDPEEEGPGGALAEPDERARHHLASAALHRGVAILLAALDLEAGVVSVEAAVETGGEPAAGIEDQRAHEGGCAIALRP